MPNKSNSAKFVLVQSCKLQERSFSEEKSYFKIFFLKKATHSVSLKEVRPMEPSKLLPSQSMDSSSCKLDYDSN